MGCCIFWSCLVGLMYTASVCVIALPEHRAKQNGTNISDGKTVLLKAFYMGFNTAAIPLMFLASGDGPVSVVVPVIIASQLLSNMVIQGIAGSLEYDKSKRIGTYVLSAAAAQLIDIGPKDPREKPDVARLLEQPLASAWLVTLAVVTVVSLCAIPKVENLAKTDLKKLGVFGAFIGITAALNNSLSKVAMTVTGPARVVCVLLYPLFGICSTVGSAYGNAGLDNALSVPVFAISQLFFNGLTGLLVWEDYKRLNAPLAYGIVYLLFALGIYLCSSVDVLQEYHLFMRGDGKAQDSETSIYKAMPGT